MLLCLKAPRLGALRTRNLSCPILRRLPAAPPSLAAHERDDDIGQMHRAQRRQKAQRGWAEPCNAERRQGDGRRGPRHAIRQKTPGAAPGPGGGGEKRRGQDANRRAQQRRRRLFNGQQRHQAHNHPSDGDLRHHYCANQTGASRIRRRRRAGPNESQVRRVP